MSESIGIREAKGRLSELISQVENGEDVVITRHGAPVARLVRFVQPGERVPGALKGRIWMADDFDELPDEVIRAFEGDETR
jgi:antitoxin (DNA-binding transcriptional repressor) of toxin-antitoxin stability system